MKLTQEILDNGEWVSEDIFKYPVNKQLGKYSKQYRVIRCKNCGCNCLTPPKYTEGFCGMYCFHSSRIGKPKVKQKPRSEEARRNASIARKGKKKSPLSEKHKEAIRCKLIGIVRSEETRNKLRGKNSPKYCPYASKGIPKYDLYVTRLEQYEECKRSKRDPNILRVRCTYCGRWFIPTIEQVGRRVKGINANDINRFYCSDSCKQECPMYKKQKYYKGQEGYSSREVQPELRQLVFVRDKYLCQKCGAKGYLHCHHITGVELNPIESADVDNCITFCKACHKAAHTDRGCRYIDLRKCPEDNQTMVVNI